MCASSGRSWTPNQKELFSHRLLGGEGNPDTRKEDKNFQSLEIAKFTSFVAENYDQALGLVINAILFVRAPPLINLDPKSYFSQL